MNDPRKPTGVSSRLYTPSLKALPYYTVINSGLGYQNVIDFGEPNFWAGV